MTRNPHFRETALGLKKRQRKTRRIRTHTSSVGMMPSDPELPRGGLVQHTLCRVYSRGQCHFSRGYSRMERIQNSADTCTATREFRAARTRAFARVIGPYLVIVPSIIILRASEMGALASEFFKNGLFVWFTGAGLLFGGLLIIAFHQYWSSLAAVLISVFGWILALRGLVLLTAPELYERAATSMGSVSLIRIIFSVIVAIGLYLTYVGWVTAPVSSSANERSGSRANHPERSTHEQPPSSD
jgi:uncharacterized protein YjeT (DUF2065 family)